MDFGKGERPVESTRGWANYLGKKRGYVLFRDRSKLIY